MVMISMAIGIAVKKFFGTRRDDADDDAQGDHRVVRALFGAMNAGDFDGLDDMIDEECLVYANGHQVESRVGDPGSEILVDSGPDLVVGTLRAIREEHPDIRWELYDEVSEKQHKTEKVVIRFVSHGTLDGEERQTEVAAFASIEDDKLTEWREVLDTTIYNLRRAAAGLASID